MRKLIERHQESLVMCDNPECDYTVPYKTENEHTTILYINKPCPKCGENLLTEEDYINHMKVMKVVDFLNRWFSWLTIFVSKKKWDNRTTVSVNVHDGIKIKKSEQNG